jgi:hypothetical protein
MKIDELLCGKREAVLALPRAMAHPISACSDQQRAVRLALKATSICW